MKPFVWGVSILARVMNQPVTSPSKTRREDLLASCSSARNSNAGGGWGNVTWCTLHAGVTGNTSSYFHVRLWIKARNYSREKNTKQGIRASFPLLGPRELINVSANLEFYLAGGVSGEVTISQRWGAAAWGYLLHKLKTKDSSAPRLARTTRPLSSLIDFLNQNSHKSHSMSGYLVNDGQCWAILTSRSNESLILAVGSAGIRAEGGGGGGLESPGTHHSPRTHGNLRRSPI